MTGFHRFKKRKMERFENEISLTFRNLRGLVLEDVKMIIGVVVLTKM